MSSSNFARTHQYLQAVASRGPFENVADFYAPEIVIQEFPNRRDAFAAPSSSGPLMSRAAKFFNRNSTQCIASLNPAMKSSPSWNEPEFSPSR